MAAQVDSRPDMPGTIPWAQDFLTLAQRYANRAAVVDAQGVVTYAELFARVAGIGQAVQATGAASCEPVGTLLPNGRMAVTASYGVTIAGVAEARLNTALSRDDLAHCLQTAGIRRVVTDRSRAPLIEQLGAQAIITDDIAPADLATCRFLSPPANGWGRIGFTSGTTGAPKGIVHSQGGRWMANVLLRAALPKTPQPGDNVLLMTPFSHGAALMTYAFLDGGAAITLLQGVDPAIALPLIERGAVNQVFAPPTVMAKLLAGTNGKAYPGLAAIYTGTAPLTGDLYRRAKAAFGPVIRITYGKSEIWNPITVLGPDEADAWYAQEGEPATMCVGWPASGVEVRIDPLGADDRDAVAAPDSIGEVMLRTRHMFIGHAVAGKFVPIGGDGFHETGDLGFIDASGRLHLVGRAADVMKSGGYKVLPEEVEADLRAAVAPAEIAVIGLPSTYWGEIVTAVIVTPDGRVPDFTDAAKPNDKLQAAATDRRSSTRSPATRSEKLSAAAPASRSSNAIRWKMAPARASCHGANRPSLPAFEARLPALGERRCPFLQILAAAEIVKRADLGLELLRQRHANKPAHRLLREPMRERRPLGQHLGVVEGAREQLALRPDPVDEPNSERMLGIDALARQDHLHGVTETDDHRQADKPSIAGMKTPFGVLQREFRGR